MILLPAALPAIFVGLRLGLVFAMINIVGVEFLINFGGLGQLINELAERYDLPRHLWRDPVRDPRLDRLLRFHRTSRAMAAAPSVKRSVWTVRIAIVAIALGGWETLSASGLLFRDVVPSLRAIGGAVARLAGAEFYTNLGVTATEVGIAMAIGGLAGLAVGIALGANRFLSRAFESLLLYLGPTPKIIFFPVMIMWFGVGSGSKIAMGAISCSSARDQRRRRHAVDRAGADPRRPELRASTWQMVTRIYLPAMREPMVNGVRLGLGVAIIGTLLAETKLSNRGLGYLVIQAYSLFDMPKMYALLIVLFALAIGANALIDRASRTANIAANQGNR